ncbi:MAG: metallophosphoesterase [Eubacteriales bacterium]|jgi:predicted phosphodiesterase
MKILAIADEEDKALWDFYKPGMLKDYDLIISCGDLHRNYLEFLVTMASCPLLYVRGNHDTLLRREPPEGCICIEDKVYDYKGLRILGLGGSMQYLPDRDDQYTEEKMRDRIKKVNREIVLRNGFDVLVTHAPAAGYGDMTDLPHRGFQCFNTLLEEQHPKYMLYGHVHQSYSAGAFIRKQKHSCGTTLINAYKKYEFEIGKDEYPAVGKTGSFLYDFVMGMKQKRKKY